MGNAEYMGARANAFTICTACVVMCGAAMFGVDQMNYANTYPLKSFYDKFCPLFDFDESCESIFSMDENDQPVAWQSFTTYGANFVPIGMAIGALLFSPLVCRKFGRRLALSL